MRTIDLCVVATLRPEILQKTLASFNDKVKYSGVINVWLNLDIVPELLELDRYIETKKTIQVFHKFLETIPRNLSPFGNATMFSPGSFCAAVKRLWVGTKSDYVFHLEDDWVFTRKIDLDECIKRMECEGISYIRFPKKNAPELNCLEKPALQPSMWRGNIVRKLAKHMDIKKDPEKQLRIGVGSCVEIENVLKKMKYADYKSNCCVDIGRDWRANKHIAKLNGEWVKS